VANIWENPNESKLHHSQRN